MSYARGEADLRLKGVGLKLRFVLSMTVALFVVMLAASILLYTGASRVEHHVQEDTLVSAVKLTQRGTKVEIVTPEPTKHPSGVEIYGVLYGSERLEATSYVARAQDPTQQDFRLIVPPADSRGGEALLGVIATTMVLVVLAGAIVALWVAGKVTQPVKGLIDDVRQISHGQLSKRIQVSGGGEIELLARSIERMTRSLEEAQDMELELSVRQRELVLAGDVREALVPVATPLVDGYDIGAVHLSSQRIGGDFHDYVELEDGRVGLLVCDVSGQGMPAALIGAIARSYLRSELLHIGSDAGREEVAECFRKVNHWLGGDVRRGVYVTALYALVNPIRGSAIVACAGHKVPLLRVTAEDKNLRAVHPEGIALGLDRGVVFDQRLEVQEVPIEPGDRLFLCNSGPVRLVNGEGRELGERAFFGRVLKHSDLDSLRFLKALRTDLLAFTGEDMLPYDVSLVTISRED